MRRARTSTGALFSIAYGMTGSVGDAEDIGRGKSAALGVSRATFGLDTGPQPARSRGPSTAASTAAPRSARAPRARRARPMAVSASTGLSG